MTDNASTLLEQVLNLPATIVRRLLHAYSKAWMMVIVRMSTRLGHARSNADALHWTAVKLLRRTGTISARESSAMFSVGEHAGSTKRVRAGRDRILPSPVRSRADRPWRPALARHTDSSSAHLGVPRDWRRITGDLALCQTDSGASSSCASLVAAAVVS